MRGVRRTVISSHHGKTSRVNTDIVRLSSSFLLFPILSAPLALLSRAVGLLHLELGALLAVVGALVVQLVVLGCDLFASCFVVATTAGTVMKSVYVSGMDCGMWRPTSVRR